jgi:hypothetical protein
LLYMLICTWSDDSASYLNAMCAAAIDAVLILLRGTLESAVQVS